LTLADGRILQIEGVTYGTHPPHWPALRSFREFWTMAANDTANWFEPRSPENTIDLERPGLVVWVNAIDPMSGTKTWTVRVSGRVVDQNGDLFEFGHQQWFGGPEFWRVGHVFYGLPARRGAVDVSCDTVDEGQDTPVTVRFANPQVGQVPRTGSGEALPQTRAVGPYTITLSRLDARTNEAKYWQTPSTWLAARLGTPS